LISKVVEAMRDDLTRKIKDLENEVKIGEGLIRDQKVVVEQVAADLNRSRLIGYGLRALSAVFFLTGMLGLLGIEYNNRQRDFVSSIASYDRCLEVVDSMQEEGLVMDGNYEPLRSICGDKRSYAPLPSKLRQLY